MAKLPAPGGDPYTYPGHSGVDFLRGPAWHGKPFYASGPGRVLRTPHNVRGGWWTTIQYDNGATIGYAHQDKRPPVSAGQRVSEGTLIGYVGASGTYVTGPHIHVENLNWATDTGLWSVFDKNRVVGQGSAASTEEEDMPLNSEDKKWIRDEIERGSRLTWTGKSSVNGSKWGDMLRVTYDSVKVGADGVRQDGSLMRYLRAVYDSVRYGKAGVRTHGDLTMRLFTELRAQSAALETLANAQGLDGTAITAAVRESVEKSLEDVSITLTAEG